MDKNVLFTKPWHEFKIYYYHDLNEIMRLSHVPTTNWIHIVLKFHYLNEFHIYVDIFYVTLSSSWRHIYTHTRSRAQTLHFTP